MNSKHSPICVFYAYSHKDDSFRQHLESHLSILKREGSIDEWHDRRIFPGTDWDGAISEAIRTSDLVLLLISSDFVASDYCYGKELTWAMQKHEARQATVIPIIIRPTDWLALPFARIQALPRDGMPISTWMNEDEAWLDVAKGIRKAVESIRRAREARHERRRGGLTRLEVALTDEVERLDFVYSGQAAYGGIPSGIIDLDDVTDGLYPGDVLVVGAPPLVEKIDFALTIAGNVALRHKLRVAIFSMRLSAQEISRKFTALIGGLNEAELLRGRFKESDWEKIIYACGQIADAPLVIDDTAGISVADIEERVGREQRTYPRSEVAVVVLDSLHNLSLGHPTDVDAQQGHLLRQLKVLGRKYGVAVIATAQVDPKQQPTEGAVNFQHDVDLRDQPSLLHEATILCVIQFPIHRATSEPESDHWFVSIAKNARGETRRFKVLRNALEANLSQPNVGGLAKAVLRKLEPLRDESVCAIINAAKELHRSGNFDAIENGQLRDKDSPQLSSLVENLNKRALVELFALISVGKNLDASLPIDWEATVRKCAEQLNERTALDILREPNLARYLEAGLSRIEGVFRDTW